ncbi:MAG: DUF1993 family protein [Pseudohongiellaceae bacterium]
MSLSMYESSVPVLSRNLRNLSALLQKGADHASANDIDSTVIINARLFPNMLPLSSQVQIACDVSKGAAARLSGTEAPSYEDNESTFEELQARISKTLEFLNSVSADSIEGTEEKEVTLQAGPQEFKFTGKVYLQSFVLPNVYFHAATAYNILRHNGVELGKLDFLGAP